MEGQVPCEAVVEPCAAEEAVACGVVGVPLEEEEAAFLDQAAVDRVGALFLPRTADYDEFHSTDCYSSEAEDISGCWSRWQLLLLWR